MRIILTLALLLSPLCAQTPQGSSKMEFDAASIRVNPPAAGFHFASDSATGGPGTADPGLFRCTGCTVATLISKAFDLQSYQFPEKASLGDSTFDLMARVPAGATHEEFLVMLQNLLKERFALTYHFKEKNVRGYHLVVAPGGLKLQESAENAPPAPAKNTNGRGGSGGGESHSHSGAMAFGGTVIYRANRQSAADLARVLTDQLNVPVDDRTGLKGFYDVDLKWSGDPSPAHAQSHGGGSFGGDAGHGDHGAPPASAGSAGAADVSGPTVFEVLQSQAGLKLTASEQTTVRVLAIDHVERTPSGN